MTRNPRFYNDVPYEAMLDKALKKKMITREDRQIIAEYIKNKISKGDIAAARANRIAVYLTQWRRYIKTPYAKMTYEDLLDGAAELRHGTSMYGRPYSPDTIRGLIKAIKTFTVYLNKKGIVKISREELGEIRPPKEITDTIKSKDLITMEQVEQLIGAAETIQTKAIIGTLADTGLRPVDLCGLQWRDLEFNKYRVKISIVSEKTNKEISPFIILHKSWMDELRKQRNQAKDHDYVFLDKDGQPMSWVAIDRQLQRTAKKADVKFPRGARAKMFRIISITMKEKAGMTRAAISKWHFGTDDSKQLPHYSKYSNDDVEHEALGIYGAKIEAKPDSPRQAICQECGGPLSPGVMVCPQCNEPIDEELKKRLARWHEIIMEEEKEMMEAMRKEIKELREKVKMLEGQSK